MIHRALFAHRTLHGCAHRTLCRAFPAWLAPEQVIAIPVAEAFNDYLLTLWTNGALFVPAWMIPLTGSRKIRTAAKHSTIRADCRWQGRANAVSFRFRDGSLNNGVLDEAINTFSQAVEQRQLV